MEYIPESVEKDAPMSIDDYLEASANFDLLDGKLPEDMEHAFFIWLSRDPAYQNIDGVIIADLYEKNVVEGDMSKERFYMWCKDFGYPYPVDSEGVITPEGEKFKSTVIPEENQKRDAAYKAWASAHGIDTRNGAVMRFVDAEGNRYRVNTDAENRGQILVD